MRCPPVDAGVALLICSNVVAYQPPTAQMVKETPHTVQQIKSEITSSGKSRYAVGGTRAHFQNTRADKTLILVLVVERKLNK